MNRLSATNMLAVSLIVMLSLAGVASGSEDSRYEKPPTAHMAGGVSHGVVVLPEKVSKSLEIARVPTSRPVPFIIGTYWSCRVNDQDFEICRFKLVVCDDDQSRCAEVP